MAEWFAGAGAFGAVAVAMWQTLNIQRRAKQDAAEAAERLRKEIAATEERSARELALMQRLHRVEMQAQRELARAQRIHLLELQQKQAMVDVSRAVSAHTRMLATLWNQGASILGIEDRDEREQAMNPIFEQIGQVVYDFSVELANAHLLIKDDHLHEALDRVNEAVLMAIRVAEDVHVAVVEGRSPHPNPIPAVQQLMHNRVSEARRLAWDLLRTSLDGG
jgi:flagellar motor switch/type III secretory pathway protein FliN